MPSRRSGGGGGGGTVRRKHSLGNVRRAHPASGADWNVQVVRGKMTSKCLWHACRALVLGLTLMLLGAGMATIGYYADYLSMGPELRGNATVRVKNDLKGFHLSNFSYVGPIVMGFGGFIVVASCVMTFEARDSAAKVVPARLRASGGPGGGGSKTTVRSNQSSSASQRRTIGMQLQSSRWDQHFGVFRTSPAEAPHTLGSAIATVPTPFDRDALTAELIKFSKSLSASARFSPQLRRLTYTGSVPNLSTIHASHHVHAHYSTNLSHLLSPRHKMLLLEYNKRNRHNNNNNRHHHHHHHHHHHTHHRGNSGGGSSGGGNTSAGVSAGPSRHLGKARGQRISNSLIQRTTRDSCALLQPPAPASRMLWHAASFDESGRAAERARIVAAERTRRSDTAKRHVLARQKPIEQQEQEEHQQQNDARSPLGHRRCSTMSDSSYSGRWTVRCASIASRTSSIDSRRIQVDLHSPEVMPKSILRSPKRYSTAVSTTPSVEKEFRSQLSVCSEPPASVRQLSGQSSLEPACFPEENTDGMEVNDKPLPLPLSPPGGHTNSIEELSSVAKTASTTTSTATPSEPNTEFVRSDGRESIKPMRPDSLPLKDGAAVYEFTKACTQVEELRLQRSSSSRTFYRPKIAPPKEFDDSIFYIRSMAEHRTQDAHDIYDSLQVINERRSTLLKADSETALLKVGAGVGPNNSSIGTGIAISGIGERKASNFSLMQEIPERGVENTSFDQDVDDEVINGKDEHNDNKNEEPPQNDVTLQMEEPTLEEQHSAALP